MIGLIPLHSVLRGAVPRSRGLTLHVLLLDERRLNLPRSRRIDALLTPLGSYLFSARSRSAPLAGRMGARRVGARRAGRRRVAASRMLFLGYLRRFRGRWCRGAFGLCN